MHRAKGSRRIMGMAVRSGFIIERFITMSSKNDLFYRKDPTLGYHKIINKRLLIKSGKGLPL